MNFVARHLILIATFLIWGAVAGALSYAGKLERFSPASLLLVGLLIPPGLFVAGYALVPAFRRTVRGLSLRALTVAEAPRTLGGSFLLWQFSRGMLPAAFALPTGISDVVFGLTAIPAAFLLYPDPSRRPSVGFLLWHCCSVSFLAISSCSGILTSPDSRALSYFPSSLVPVFLGPLMIVIEMAAIAQILARRGESTSHFAQHER